MHPSIFWNWKESAGCGGFNGRAALVRAINLRASGVPRLLCLALIAAISALSQTQLTDDFTKDTTLNSSLWSTGTTLLKTDANGNNSTLIQPTLSFSGAGMSMSGTTGISQITGIQSNRTFTPPFTVTSTVMGTLSNGNTFLVNLVNSNFKQYVQVAGNLNPNNVGAFHYYGINITSSASSGVLYANPSVNVPYTVVMTIGTTGTANVEVFSSGTLQGFQNDIAIGTGPFYLILGQFEGLPYTVGPNTAVWQNVEVDALTSPLLLSKGGVISAGGFGGFSTTAPGSWIEIYGTGLGPDTRSWAGLDFKGVTAPSSLDSTSVTIGGKQAFIDYISPTQINAQVPDVSPGPQQIVVTSPSGTSLPYTITVNPVEPGLLAPSSFLISGNQYAVALFPDGLTYALPPGAIAVPSRRSKPGDTITLYGIGFGSVTPSIPAGQIVGQSNSLTNSIQVSIGGAPATVAYSALAPSYIGLYQLNIVVPNVPANDLTPLTFSLGGIPGTQTLYLPIGQ